MLGDSDEILTQLEKWTAMANRDVSPAVWQCALCPQCPVDIACEFGVDQVRSATFPYKEKTIMKHMKNRYVHHSVYG